MTTVADLCLFCTIKNSSVKEVLKFANEVDIPIRKKNMREENWRRETKSRRLGETEISSVKERAKFM